MSDVNLSVEEVLRSGLAASYTGSLSTENTYKFLNDGRVLLHFKKTGAGDCTVTIPTQNSVDGLAIADRTVTIPATTGDKFIGPFPQSIYNDSDGKVNFTLSEVTDLTVAVVRI